MLSQFQRIVSLRFETETCLAINSRARVINGIEFVFFLARELTQKVQVFPLGFLDTWERAP